MDNRKLLILIVSLLVVIVILLVMIYAEISETNRLQNIIIQGIYN